MFRDSGIRIRGQVPEFALFLRDLVQNDSRTTVVDTEGSATLKSKVFGAKKAKEKQENVTGFSEERKRKGKVKKQTWVLQ